MKIVVSRRNTISKGVWEAVYHGDIKEGKDFHRYTTNREIVETVFRNPDVVTALIKRRENNYLLMIRLDKADGFVNPVRVFRTFAVTVNREDNQIKVTQDKSL